MEQNNSLETNININNRNNYHNLTDTNEMNLMLPEINYTIFDPDSSSNDSAPIVIMEEGPSIPRNLDNDFPRFSSFSRRSNLRISPSSRFYSSFILRDDNNGFPEYEVDIENDNCLAIERNSKNLYGTLTMATVRKLLSNKLISLTIISERIYRKIFDVYYNNLNYEKEDTKSMFKLTKLFINCLPSLKQISKYLNKINFNSDKENKNIFFIKMCLNVYEDYLKTFDFPLFRKYKNVFLDVAFKYYTKTSEENINKIHEQITTLSLNHLNIKTNGLKTKKDYIDYYNMEKLQYQSISDGMELTKFII